MADMGRTWGAPARTQEAVDQTHPGFTVTCQGCRSTLVYVESSVGGSAESGGWGSVDLVCDNCDQRTEVYEA